MAELTNRSVQADPFGRSAVRHKLAALAGSADAAPTDQSYRLHEELTSKINAQLKTLEAALAADLPAFNKLVRDQNVPAVVLKKPAAR